MSGTDRAGGYRALLSRPHVLRPILLAALGRLGYAMLPLLLLFTLKDASASFTTATTAMSAFGLAGLLMPLKSRLIDHLGQRRVLPLLGVATLATIEVVVGMATTRVASRPLLWVALTAVAGAAAPPLGPATRAQWRAVAPDDLDTAYALDGTMEEVLWLVGPAISGVLLTTSGPEIGLAAVPVMLMVGCLGLAASPFGGSQPAAESSPGHAALRSRRLWPILATMAATGVSTALLLTGMAAVADSAGVRSLAAAAEVALGVGAVAGGFLWGHARPQSTRRTATCVLILVWAAVVLAVRGLGLHAPTLALLGVAGAASAPVWVLAYGAADEAVPEGARTEASTWVTTAANLGSAAGTALTGTLVAAFEPPAPLAAAGLLAVLAAVVTWWRWTPQA